MNENIIKIQGTQFSKDEEGWVFVENPDGVSTGFNTPEDLILLETLITLKKIERKLK